MKYPKQEDLFKRLYILMVFSFTISILAGVIICNALGRAMVTRTPVLTPTFASFLPCNEGVKDKSKNYIIVNGIPEKEQPKNLILETYDNNRNELEIAILDKNTQAGGRIVSIKKTTDSLSFLGNKYIYSLKDSVTIYDSTFISSKSKIYPVIFLENKDKYTNENDLIFELFANCQLPIEKCDGNLEYVKKCNINFIGYDYSIVIYPRFLFIGCLFSVFVGLFLQMITEEKSFTEIS